MIKTQLSTTENKNSPLVENKKASEAVSRHHWLAE